MDLVQYLSWLGCLLISGTLTIKIYNRLLTCCMWPWANLHSLAVLHFAHLYTVKLVHYTFAGGMWVKCKIKVWIVVKVLAHKNFVMADVTRCLCPHHQQRLCDLILLYFHKIFIWSSGTRR